MDPKAQKLQLKFDDAADGKPFNPSRLTFARRRRGYNKTDLAKAAKMNIRSITALESGEFAPLPDTVEKLASALSFPPEFFCGDDLDEVILESGSFRSMSKMTARQRDMALCQATIALQVSRWIEAKFELPPPQVLDLSAEPDPEAAAEAVRRAWSLGALPIRNMVHILESKGIRVFSLAVDAREVDAFSVWNGGTPYVFLNTNKTAEHSRFDAAHELGHLVLHKHGSPHGRNAEMQANRFASAFLMPRASILANAPRFPTYETLVRLKRVWSVSVAALAYRLHQLNVLTEWQYRTLAIEITRNDRTKEPNGIARETSLVMPKVFAELQEEGITRGKLAKRLAINPGELDELLMGLAIAAIEGGGGKTERTSTAELRRVK